jgi:hypothetical protein
MTQNERLFAHLMAGKTITRFEAFISLDIQNLTARVADLRTQHDVAVECRMKTDPKGRDYGEFYLDRSEIAYQEQKRIDAYVCTLFD